MKIKTVTVLAASGTMGINISAIFASFGNAKVYMVGRDIDKVQNSIEKAIKSVRADSIKENLIPADFSMLENCVAESDLVFESAKEDLNIKIEITKRVASALQPHAIACTGTSGLSVTTLAECFPEELRGNYFGVHMFNPPYSMTLCEVIPTKYSDSEMHKELKEYLSNVLLRTVVDVKDSPAFLGNRIGFQFINEAMHYADKYKESGGIDYIDAILGPYTGRSMAPLNTADFVSLDVSKAIVDNLYENTKDYAHNTFLFPEFAEILVNKGWLGRKTKGGLYKQERLDSGIRRILVYDIFRGGYREQNQYVFPFAEKMIAYIREGSYKEAFETLINNNSHEAEICLELILKYVIYSLMASESIGENIHVADDVMATGFNWCPPFAIIDALSTVTDFERLVHERLGSIDVDIKHLVSLSEPSKYDYRLFFKAKR